MPFLISHLPPANSFFQKTSILKNLIPIDAVNFFHITNKDYSWDTSFNWLRYAEKILDLDTKPT